MKKVFVILLFLLLSTSLAFAAEEVDWEAFRGARAARIECHANLNIDIANTLIELRPDSAEALNANIEEVNTEVAALKESTSDASVFNNNVAEAWGAITELRLETVSQRNEGRPYVLAEHLSNLEAFGAALETFKTCRLTAVAGFAQARIAHYSTVLERLDGAVDALEANGVDVTEGREILADARTEVLNPLQAAVDAAETPAEVTKALQDYCLYNGCFKGKNFHLAAKLNLARLRAIANFLESAGGDADDLADARASIEESQTALDSVGDSVYGLGDWLDVADPAEDAASKLRAINRAIKSPPASDDSSDDSGDDSSDDSGDTNSGSDTNA